MGSKAIHFILGVLFILFTNCKKTKNLSSGNNNDDNQDLGFEVTICA